MHVPFQFLGQIGIAEYSYSSHDPQVYYYTNRGYYVVTYDYRGCGGSTGAVTPENTVSDAKRIIQLMNSNYHLSLEIVHGTSIGGYVVTGLADQSSLSIYDRNFVNMNSMVDCMVRRFSYP